eukprot:CAMPEP_0178986922 /NCGR_PEP_ID=MMETSP0795-20121207/2972_1 /TAXON_ID=88552 /ORGANISM="Amoebophrya sp., Strain Ameob2" /LENGTH=486 /DNA_ID=CAMNT_0020678035 /DNA_START=1262 /DNA_END=2719 /DNA_ORIENTATION=+
MPSAVPSKKQVPSAAGEKAKAPSKAAAASSGCCGVKGCRKKAVAGRDRCAGPCRMKCAVKGCTKSQAVLSKTRYSKYCDEHTKAQTAKMKKAAAAPAAAAVIKPAVIKPAATVKKKENKLPPASMKILKQQEVHKAATKAKRTEKEATTTQCAKDINYKVKEALLKNKETAACLPSSADKSLTTAQQEVVVQQAQQPLRAGAAVGGTLRGTQPSKTSQYSINPLNRIASSAAGRAGSASCSSSSGHPLAALPTLKRTMQPCKTHDCDVEVEVFVNPHASSNLFSYSTSTSAPTCSRSLYASPYCRACETTRLAIAKAAAITEKERLCKLVEEGGNTLTMDSTRIFLEEKTKDRGHRFMEHFCERHCRACCYRWLGVKATGWLYDEDGHQQAIICRCEEVPIRIVEKIVPQKPRWCENFYCQVENCAVGKKYCDECEELPRCLGEECRAGGTNFKCDNKVRRGNLLCAGCDKRYDFPVGDSKAKMWW